MPSPKSDFAHPVAKGLGCFLLLPAFPAVLVACIAGVQLPWELFPASALVSLTGLGGLLGRPSTIVEAIRAGRTRSW